MNAIQYPSKKGTLTGSIMAVVLLFLIGEMLVLPFHEKPLAYVALALPIGLMAWTWFGTSYRMDASHLYFASGPFRGKIALASITQVTCGETMWAGYRPALARKGIVVRYNRWDEIYISPKDQEAFVAALVERNPGITVVVKNDRCLPGDNLVALFAGRPYFADHTALLQFLQHLIQGCFVFSTEMGA